ncbi:MAG TPA: DUF3683 domain-containing protein [Spirochaetota bacterium]|nr:DUF3683 domain-containing protein [Spirochaetota bacterium]
MNKKDKKFREIPYNYTSFSDHEVVLRYFDEESWEIINHLRNTRVTGRSAKLLFESIGDLFIVERNPYVYNEHLENSKKLKKLKHIHEMRFRTIERYGADNPLVIKLIAKCREVEKAFFSRLDQEKKQRKKIMSVLEKVVSKSNIHFSAFHKVSHVTDATDWRVEYPAVVVYPEHPEEIVKIIHAARQLGLSIIPRGGGTGLTGGAVPVNRTTLVLNTEKLHTIGPITILKSGDQDIPVIEVEAGAVTEDVIRHCESQHYIFATDPTSAWASTIGGNIAENAGGKKCVMWGTAIDNIYSFEIINAKGERIEVVRRNHPHRKILSQDEVIFDVFSVKKRRKLLTSITLAGTDIRKDGLGKDITNKALNGLPGVQKEGGDGVIVSARFVLYRPFEHKRTLCLEFFGRDLINASKAIVDIKKSVEKSSDVFLTALEHFDEKYVLAINYRNKSERTETPKAVLLIDVESNNVTLLDEMCRDIITMVRGYNTEGFIAENEKAAVRFWQDRKNLGAIARHTNAFKLNEDVVIPIENLPLFADFIDKLNVTKELSNNVAIISDIEEYLEKMVSDDEFLGKKVETYLTRVKGLRSDYREYIEHLDTPASSLYKYQSQFSNEKRSIFKLIQEGEIVISFEDDVISSFQNAFKGYEEELQEFNAVVAEQRNRKVIVATHMHAGDGNVHVNIPVHSNDYLMMKEADETAGIIMEETVKMGGVISGEHGIGLTKLRFIEPEILARYADYKKLADPDDLFNPGKLSPDFPLHRIYTPSFNLLELEAFILKAADLEKLSNSISSCVRCGKCKSVCNTHYPRGNIFYNPRNKILGVAKIIEAVLYDAQQSKSLNFKYFNKLQEISDHCTICHKCQVPCPVNIDFGQVTLDIRDILVSRKKSKFKLITGFTLYYLRKRGYYFNKIFRILLLRVGYTAQRVGHIINRPFTRLTVVIIPKINGYLRDRFPRAGHKTLREVVRSKGSNAFIAFQNPVKDVKKSVVYFPGCGSERMFSEISMATVALLYYAGVRVVMPPEYLCCGYPLRANGKTELAEMKSYENRVVFHKMADIIGYMDIDKIIVSCGTCYEMLEEYELDSIFPEAELMDINEYIVLNKMYQSDRAVDTRVLYHEPCHTPLKHYGYETTLHSVVGATPELVPYCCGEGGTLALSTPLLSNSLRNRKVTDITPMINGKNTLLLTTCPSCYQGLSKMRSRIPVTVKPMVVYFAETFLGNNWKRKFLRDVKRGGFENILF